MSHWFTIRLRPAVGSLAAATTALAAADVAIVGIVGSAESDDGVVHLAVDQSARERATAALHKAGIDNIILEQRTGEYVLKPLGFVYQTGEWVLRLAGNTGTYIDVLPVGGLFDVYGHVKWRPIFIREHVSLSDLESVVRSCIDRLTRI